MIIKDEIKRNLATFELIKVGKNLTINDFIALKRPNLEKKVKKTK